MPEWSDQSPSKIIEQIQEMIKARKAQDPRNFVFEYSANTPRDRAYVMDRKAFDDGRYRIFLHPDRRESIEAHLASIDQGEES